MSALGNTHLLSHGLGTQETKHDSPVSSGSQSLTRLPSKVSASSEYSSEGLIGKDLLPSSRMWLLDSVLQDCWTVGLCSLLAVGRPPPSVTCHMGLFNISTCFIKARKRVCQQDESHKILELNHGSYIPSLLLLLGRSKLFQTMRVYKTVNSGQ